MRYTHGYRTVLIKDGEERMKEIEKEGERRKKIEKEGERREEGFIPTFSIQAELKFPEMLRKR